MSFATMLLVAIAALIAVAGMIIWPQLRQRLFAHDRLSPKHRQALVRGLPWSRALNARQRNRLISHATYLISETVFIGAQGVAVTDRQRRVIAGQAALLSLGAQPLAAELPSEIVVYPGAIDSNFETGSAQGLVEDLADMAVGPHPTGSRIALSWPAVKAALAGSIRNPIVRAFVHLTNFSDSWDDSAVAPAVDSWTAALSAQQQTIAISGSTLLDLPAGATLERFLAPAAEAFFQRPRALRATHPELYDLLAAYFDLDTARQPPRFRRRKKR